MSTQPTASSSPWKTRFYAIWTGQAFSLLGSRLVQFALIWWLTEQTGSASVLAGATIAAVLPQVLLGPLAGALVDRHSRRLLMILADGLIALSVAVLALLFHLDRIQLWHIYVVIVVRALGGVVHWPAMQAATTLLVPSEQLSRVGGMNQTLQGVANLFVPPLGAMAIALLSMQSVLAIDVVTAMLAIGPLLFVRIPQPETRVRQLTLLGDMREGLRYVLNWRALMLFAGIGTLCNMLGGVAGSLTPLLVTEHFGGGAAALGWMQSAAGVGAISGGLVLSVWAGIKRRMVVSLLALTLDGVFIASVALAPATAFWLALACMFGIGLLEAMVLGLHGAIGQIIIPPEMQGRVFSLVGTLGGIAMPLALAIAGPTTDLLGVQFWWLMAGIVITLTGAAALATPAVRKIEQGR